MNQLLVIGMFRSGTTLLSHILSAHPQMLVVSDPFIYFFKAYRSFLYQKKHASFHPDEPTSDFFYDQNHPILMDLLSRDLSEKMPESYQEKVRKDIYYWKLHQHPMLCERLNEVRGNTFREFYEELMSLLVIVYGNQNLQYVGTKVSWCEEFVPILCRAFPRMKFLMITRDIRSIVASQNSKRGEGEGKRPLLFYIRNWRKSIAFITIFTKLNPLCSKRMYHIRYEDLVNNTSQEISHICEFLKIPYAETMVDPTAYWEAKTNTQWTPNTSYESQEGVYSASVEKWKEVLTSNEINYIERFCEPELKLMGYPLIGKPVKVENYIRDLPEPDFEDLASWIKPFSCVDYLRNSSALHKELEKEYVRDQYLNDRMPGHDTQQIEKYFISEDYYKLLKGSYLGYRNECDNNDYNA